VRIVTFLLFLRVTAGLGLFYVGLGAGINVGFRDIPENKV